MISFVTHVRQNGLVENDIYMTRGDDGYITLPIYNADGSEHDPTSDTVECAVKESKVVDSTAVTVLFTGTVTITDGVAVWHISNTDSAIDAGVYYWDCQVTTSGGDVFTVYGGKFTIVGEVVS